MDSKDIREFDKEIYTQLDTVDHNIVYSGNKIKRAVIKMAYVNIEPIIQYSSDELLYVCVMNGAVQLFCNVTKLLPPAYCHYIRASSYHENEQSSEVKIIQPTDMYLAADIKQIIIFDDICDSGKTLQAVVKYYQNTYPNTAITTAVLLHRLRDDAIYKPNFAAIQTDSTEWFAGYGLDNKGKDRTLDYIYSIPQDIGG